MNKDQAAARKHIEEEWRDRPVYARELCEDYLKKYPADGYIWALYGDVVGRLVVSAVATARLELPLR